jgi:hypothetical protein
MRLKMNHKGSDFDLSMLSHDDQKNRKGSFLSIRKAFKDSFYRYLVLSKKAKMMFFVFSFMGFVIASRYTFLNEYAIGIVLFMLVIKKIYLKLTILHQMVLIIDYYNRIKEAEDDTFYINIYKISAIIIQYHQILQGENSVYLNADLGIHDHLLKIIYYMVNYLKISMN